MHVHDSGCDAIMCWKWYCCPAAATRLAHFVEGHAACLLFVHVSAGTDVTQDNGWQVPHRGLLCYFMFLSVTVVSFSLREQCVDMKLGSGSAWCLCCLLPCMCGQARLLCCYRQHECLSGSMHRCLHRV
jgi:hypothetical protein